MPPLHQRHPNSLFRDLGVSRCGAQRPGPLPRQAAPLPLGGGRPSPRAQERDLDQELGHWGVEGGSLSNPHAGQVGVGWPSFPRCLPGPEVLGGWRLSPCFLGATGPPGSWRAVLHPAVGTGKPRALAVLGIGQKAPSSPPGSCSAEGLQPMASSRQPGQRVQEAQPRRGPNPARLAQTPSQPGEESLPRASQVDVGVQGAAWGALGLLLG